MVDEREGMSSPLELEEASLIPVQGGRFTPDGTTNHSTKPASEQVAGKPQPCHPQGVRRRAPAASQRPFRSLSRGSALTGMKGQT